MTNWFDRLVGGTRGELLTLLRRAERSINELAEKLGISDNAVRMHIASLQRDGMVEAAGYRGRCEVEILSAERWWKRDPDEVLRICIDRHRTVV